MGDADILLRHMCATLRDSEALFCFRKAFIGQLAANSFLRRPDEIPMLDHDPGRRLAELKVIRVRLASDAEGVVARCNLGFFQEWGLAWNGTSEKLSGL